MCKLNEIISIKMAKNVKKNNGVGMGPAILNIKT